MQWKSFSKIVLAFVTGCDTFGTVTDTKDRKTELMSEVKARVPRSLKTKIERIARRRMQSTSDVVRAALGELVKNQEVA